MVCELCGISSFGVMRNCLRHDIKRKVLKCKKCSLVFLEPKNFDAKNFYSGDYRKIYTPLIGKATNSRQIFDLYKPFQYERVKRLKSILRKNMRVLDIGASAGHFLHTLCPHVRECIALEFNKSDVDFIRKKLKLRAYDIPLQETDLPYEYFDLITIFQTFEHIERPIEFLSHIAPYLKKDGYLAIEVPNIEESLLTLYDVKSYEDFYFREAHVFYYSPKTLKRMLKKGGFNGSVSTVHRMNFLNNIHWIMTGVPQKGPHLHMASAKLPTVKGANPAVIKNLNEWLQETDTKYREFLNRFQIGESIWFIGKKSK